MSLGVEVMLLKETGWEAASCTESEKVWKLGCGCGFLWEAWDVVSLSSLAV